MNSKSERGGYKITRIKVDKSKWEADKEVELAEKVSKWEDEVMQKL